MERRTPSTGSADYSRPALRADEPLKPFENGFFLNRLLHITV
jgi:hypothetical protein